MAAWMLLVLASLWIPAAAADEDVSCVITKSCVLPCSFKSGLDPIVQWYKVKDPKDINVHRFQNDKGQDPDYRGRTSLFKNEISRGNASLLLSGLRLTDQGRYKCFTNTLENASTSYINLRVEGAVGPVSIKQSGDVLLYSSENIYLKPSVSWSRSPPSQSEPTSSVQESKEQVYSVSSSVPLAPSPPLEYTCNISTVHSWRSATYSWRPPVVDSGNVFVSCTASMTSIKKLKWTFNSDQTILIQNETGVVHTAAPWSQFVVSVSESGDLTLHKLTIDQHGVYLCEQHTDTETYFTKTEVKADPTPAVVGGIVSFLIIIIFIIVGAVYYFKRKREKREKDLYLNQRKQEQQQQRQLENFSFTLLQQQQPEEVRLLELSEGGQSPTLFSQLLEPLEKLSNNDFKTFKSLLKDKSVLKDFEEIPQNNLETEDRIEIVKVMMETYGVHSITVTKRALERMEKYELLNDLSGLSAKGVIWSCQSKLKSELETRFKFLTEGITESGSLFEQYTETFVTIVNTGQMKTCEDIFKGQTKKGEPIRVVLTKGVAGIGKTVLTQKFSLGWIEGRANQNIQLLFPFTFRELNVLRDRRFSLEKLLQHFFGESEGLCSLQNLQMVFIFDSLDECRLPLDFTQTLDLTDPKETVSVDVLLVNLIRGRLLPSARVWITTRPAAANQIPAECVSMVTEVRGFSDPQKEQYFRKRFTDEEQATAVISHIKKTHVLHTMCHIPVFCWILATVTENMIKNSKSSKLPQTLTELYIHFLVVQAKVKNIKDWDLNTRRTVKSLGKLAFEQLRKGNLNFYESDLRQCGLEPTEASAYSGVFTQVFREQTVLENKVYWFTHLSVQEFLAALHIHQSFVDTGVNLLSEQVKDSSPDTIKPKLQHLHQTAVDLALQSPNRHLDLFLRFLLGLSLSTNQSLLQGLLTQTGSKQTNQETVKYIHKKLDGRVSTERSLNLLHCLNELNDHSLVEEIQRYMREGLVFGRDMSPAQWSALVFFLLSSDTPEGV